MTVTVPQVVTLLCCVVCAIVAIDPQERIGSCRPIKLHNVTYNVFSNEGVWFPQYRTKESRLYTKGIEYCCHTLYDKVYVTEEHPTILESDSYYSVNGNVKKEAFTSSYQCTKEKAKLETSVEISGHGQYNVYYYILQLTPDYRIRYICTDFKITTPGVAAIYIDTRKTFPTKNTIYEAHKVLLKHGLTNTLVKIKQKDCTRPLSKDGYIRPSSEEQSKKSPK